MNIKEFRKKTGVFIGDRLTGKMEGVPHLSSSYLENPACIARAKIPGTICAKCYAATTCKRYPEARDAYAQNGRILSRRIIPVEEWPLLNYRVFRLESFGDLINVKHAKNYFNFCKRNPLTTFALWTKRPDVIARALKTAEKPDNLIIIYSSPYINKESAPDYDFIDKTFTVYDDDRPTICAGKSCLQCGRCYSKKTTKRITETLHK